MENFIFKNGIPWWYFITMIALFALNIFLYHEIMKEKILKGKYPENFIYK